MLRAKLVGRIVLAGLIVGLTLGVATMATLAQSGRIAVGSKDFNENILLGEIIAQLVESRTDLRVDRKLNLGGTVVNFQAIRSGDIDIYVDYTGTLLVNLLSYEPVFDPQEAFDIVKRELARQHQLAVLDPLGFNNTYVLVMRRADAERLGVRTISDLVPHSPNLSFGAPHETLLRADGYPGLQRVYGLNFRRTQGMAITLMYAAIRDGFVDVIPAFSTDGEIKAYDLYVLQDDKRFYPPYDAVILVRQQTLDRYPQLLPVLNLLVGKIDESTMQELNARVNLTGDEIEDVARDFLRSAGLLNP